MFGRCRFRFLPLFLGRFLQFLFLFKAFLDIVLVEPFLLAEGSHGSVLRFVQLEVPELFLLSQATPFLALSVNGFLAILTPSRPCLFWSAAFRRAFFWPAIFWCAFP